MPLPLSYFEGGCACHNRQFYRKKVDMPMPIHNRRREPPCTKRDGIEVSLIYKLTSKSLLSEVITTPKGPCPNTRLR